MLTVHRGMELSSLEPARHRNPLAGNSVFYPTVEWFHGAFCNTMSLTTETRQEFDPVVVPESRNTSPFQYDVCGQG
ncbi:MAG: hypothetical protein U0V64_16875 [Cyclobacteriaceae bacterium]